MTWVKLDDAFPDHPKVDRLSDGAFRLHVAALCHCGRHLTDGHVAAERVSRLVPRFRRAHVEELVAADLWHPADGGWAIHDFLIYNPTAEKVKAERAAAADRMRRHRSGERAAKRSPTPVPARPDPPASSSSSSPPEREEPTPTTDDVPSEVWQEYARLKRAAAGRPVQNVAAYERATIVNARLELGATAARWWADFDVRPSELAAGLVEGSAGRYWTRRKAAS